MKWNIRKIFMSTLVFIITLGIVINIDAIEASITTFEVSNGVATTDGLYHGNLETTTPPTSNVVENPTMLTYRYTGNKALQQTYQIFNLDDMNTPLETGNYVENVGDGMYFDLASKTIFERGTFYIVRLQFEDAFGDVDQDRVTLYFDYITANIVIDRPINPTNITNGSDRLDSETTATLTWEIKDENGTVMLTGFGPDVSEEQLKGLPDGAYTISNTASATTILGTNISDTVVDSFIIRTPQASITIDGELNPKDVIENPSVIVIEQKLPDSTLQWIIVDENGNQVSSGTVEVTIPTEDGTYIIRVIETSTEGEISEVVAKIIITSLEDEDPIIPENPGPKDPDPKDPYKPREPNPDGPVQPQKPNQPENFNQQKSLVPASNKQASSIYNIPITGERENYVVYYTTMFFLSVIGIYIKFNKRQSD